MGAHNWLGQYIMLLVVPLTLADSNQHNLADSMDSARLCQTRVHQIPPDSTELWQILPNLAHVMLSESSGDRT